jgi:uncharacterized protein YaiE (UPF0345 family)
VVSILSFKREPYVLGAQSVEVWYNYGGDNSSIENPTFAINAGGVIEYGCGAPNSPNTVDGSVVMFLSDKGQWIEAAGYQGKVASNQMFDREVATYATFSDATSFGYRDQGHVFCVLNLPTASKTWVLDLTTKTLHRRTSYLETGGFGRWRANCHALLNNIHYVGDYENGTIYTMSPNYYSDNGEAIQRIVYTKEMDGGTDRTCWPSLQLIVESGVDVPQGLDPQIMMQFSNDSYTWSSEVWASAGKVGEYLRQARWNRVGSSYKRMYKFVMTDPVLWRILGIGGTGGK